MSDNKATGGTEERAISVPLKGGRAALNVAAYICFLSSQMTIDCETHSTLSSQVLVFTLFLVR